MVTLPSLLYEGPARQGSHTRSRAKSAQRNVGRALRIPLHAAKTLMSTPTALGAQVLRVQATHIVEARAQHVEPFLQTAASGEPLKLTLSGFFRVTLQRSKRPTLHLV